MPIQNKVVLHNPTTKKHEPLVSGDKLAGSLIQLSTDVGNSVVLGTDGGLKVSIPAQLPDDQVLTGDNTGSVSVTLAPTVVGDQTNYLIKADTKIDPAVGNIATVSSEGLYVPTPVVTASKQVEFGNVASVAFNGVNINEVGTIVFAVPFPTAPFVFPVTAELTGDIQPLGGGVSIVETTTIGFTYQRPAISTPEGSIVYAEFNWKAEEN